MKVVPKTAELANQLAWWHNFTFKFLQNFKTKNPDLVSKWCHATTCFYFLKIKNFFERQIVFKFWIEICRKRPTTTFHFQHFLNLRFAFCFRLNSWRKGREPWYSGYGRRLMFQRSWVRIPVPYTGWTFSHLFVVKFVCLKRPKINEKEAENGPFKKSSWRRSLKRMDLSVVVGGGA